MILLWNTFNNDLGLSDIHPEGSLIKNGEIFLIHLQGTEFFNKI